MRAQPSCPRCGSALHPPGLWSSSWRCDDHGSVPPVHPAVQPTPEVLRAAASAAATAGVPMWLPWPLPRGWLVTGVVSAGDERTGARATAVVCSGPSPLGGVADLVLVGEETGVGLGPGSPASTDRTPGSSRTARRTPRSTRPGSRPRCGRCPGPGVDDRAVYVGEALGCWLWAVLWPETAGFLLIDDFVLTDLRDAGPRARPAVRGAVPATQA